MSRSILAAVTGGPANSLRFERLSLEDPRPDEVLVRIAASGICHTDLGFLDAREPLILGHEGAGVVEAVGGDVRGFAPGDHVVLSYASCGRCPACKSDRPAHCEHFLEANFDFARLDGSNAYGPKAKGHFFGQSSLASHSLTSPRNLVKVDPAWPLELLAPLGCGLQTGAGTIINTLAVRPGESVAVFGAGTVGLAAIMAGRLKGAAPIIAVDLVPERLELARELGATHTVANDGRDVARDIRAIAARGVDHIVENTGDATLLRLAEELLAPGGSAALLTGLSGPGELSGGRRVFGVIQGDAVPQRFIPWLIERHLAGEFPFDRLLRQYAFADVNRAIEDMVRGRTVKPVVRMEGGASPAIRP